MVRIHDGSRWLRAGRCGHRWVASREMATCFDPAAALEISEEYFRLYAETLTIE